jgi:hypothetical protein
MGDLKYVPVEGNLHNQDLTHTSKDGTERPACTVRTFNGSTFEIKRRLSLSFRTGRGLAEFRDVEFDVLEDVIDGTDEDDGVDAAHNDVSDMLLGAPWLTRNSVLMVDPHFAILPPEHLEVLESIPEGAEQACYSTMFKPSKSKYIGAPVRQGISSVKYTLPPGGSY